MNPHQKKPVLRLTAVIASIAVAGLLSAPSFAATRDSDGDGMPNRWELNHNLNPRVANAKGDPDHDGLRNITEYRQGALPRDEDTNDDGTPDAAEDSHDDGVDNATEDDSQDDSQDDSDDQGEDGQDECES